MREYTDNTEVPIVAEFAYLNDIPRQYLYDMPELADALKRLIDKKEFALEKGMLTAKLNPTGAIFSLKQLGWSDKQETTHKGIPPLKLSPSDGAL